MKNKEAEETHKINKLTIGSFMRRKGKKRSMQRKGFSDHCKGQNTNLSYVWRKCHPPNEPLSSYRRRHLGLHTGQVFCFRRTIVGKGWIEEGGWFHKVWGYWKDGEYIKIIDSRIACDLNHLGVEDESN